MEFSEADMRQIRRAVTRFHTGITRKYFTVLGMKMSLTMVASCEHAIISIYATETDHHALLSLEKVTVESVVDKLNFHFVRTVLES